MNPRLPLLLAAAVALGGCYVPNPQAHAELKISAAGDYTFNGEALTAAALEPALQKASQAHSGLVVQIEAAPDTDVAAVQRAVGAVKAAHARVAFAKGSAALVGGNGGDAADD